MSSSSTPASATSPAADEVQHALRVVVFAMATLAEQRESDTESHILRVQGYVRVLAKQLGTHPAFEAMLTPATIDTLCNSVPLYDMGSVGVPDRILLKPGRLTADEVNIMRTHTTAGHEALVRAEKTMGRPSPLLDIAKELVLSHQEKWDGSGYPQRLSGTQIPASARIMALADVYDALITNKVYKDGVSHTKAVDDLERARRPLRPRRSGRLLGGGDRVPNHRPSDMQRKMEYMPRPTPTCSV
jgi:putative two-component system response regulator